MKPVCQDITQATIGSATAQSVIHSPLPWFINECSGTEIGFDRVGSTEDNIEIVTAVEITADQIEQLDGGEDEAKANAEFIVRAVNNHEALLAALNYLQSSPNDPRAHRAALDAIAAATL